MSNHIENRAAILRCLKEELVGPSPTGTEIDCTAAIEFEDPKEAYRPRRQAGSGDEILQRDHPSRRYGIGVLYPLGSAVGDELAETGFIGRDASLPEDDRGEDSHMANPLEEALDKNKKGLGYGALDEESDDLDLSLANSYKPSSMAISFLAELPPGSYLRVMASGGRYVRRSVKVQGQERTWWIRSTVGITVEFSQNDLNADSVRKVPATRREDQNTKGLELEIEVFSRPYQRRETRLLTVCLVNRSGVQVSADEHCLFQSRCEATVVSADGQSHILPYPRTRHEQLDAEEQVLALLYREAETFGVGHGCAADWTIATEDKARAQTVIAQCLPIYEAPSITPDVRRRDGTVLEIPIAQLAGLIDGDDGFDALAELVEEYEGWVSHRKAELANMPGQYRAAAERNIQECVRCIDRMRNGVAYLQRDAVGLRAFQLANHAILLQQVRSRREPRRIDFDPKSRRLVYREAYEEPDPLDPPMGRGKWRAFQIAFLLMAVESTAEGRSVERAIVELIWFPTGGGKTEAYFALAAFAMFVRRLRKPHDAGVTVLMRYTLRLLTAQQFQRASSLICAMEYIRTRMPTEELGAVPFSIGIWLGAATTPNTQEDALKTLRELQRGDRESENKLLVSRCPWCGAEMGPIKYPGRVPRSVPRVAGYEQEAKTVVFKCPDACCPFSSRLPVYVIDQAIYAIRPGLVIGTVDKFAMLPWKPEARSLFGLSSDGEREFSPPGLIIQDELHLISGPLGSMVGLYEVMIEELCTDRRNGAPLHPKIVSSTATIRRYRAQIRALYGRTDVMLFPPPGLNAADSFFARYATTDDGHRRPGTIYVGVHAPGLGSVQTAQVRSFASLLQAPVELSPDARDPWWTLMVFFNSLRELGTTLSLFQSDVRDYLKVLRNRYGLEFSQIRKLPSIKELTGRLRSDEVPAAITALEVSCTSSGGKPVDVCLASNIIEVGIDIDRLSLMAVVGQPKSTAQYIQVTGRIGRRWWERPGLVVTIYSPSKPRDRSHFEKFRSYHARLYEQVEPTSLTPFSAPALDRALHAVMAGYVRQTGDGSLAHSPDPYPAKYLDFLRGILIERVKTVNPDEIGNVENMFRRRAEEWRRWRRTRWSASWDDLDAPLLREAGGYAVTDWLPVSWATPTSMRNVDAECQMEITHLYLLDEEEDA